MGQPTLLYLVTFTLGPMCTLVYARGELQALWAGRQVETATVGIGVIDREGGPGEGWGSNMYPAGHDNESWGLLGVGGSDGSKSRPTQIQAWILLGSTMGRDP
jgi:hypothetical protein